MTFKNNAAANWTSSDALLQADVDTYSVWSSLQSLYFQSPNVSYPISRIPTPLTTLSGLDEAPAQYLISSVYFFSLICVMVYNSHHRNGPITDPLCPPRAIRMDAQQDRTWKSH